MPLREPSSTILPESRQTLPAVVLRKAPGCSQISFSMKWRNPHFSTWIGSHEIRAISR
jgi:hypothetical protein